MRVIDRLKKPVIIKPRKTIPATPCALEIGNLFNCWRSFNNDQAKCAEGAAQLLACMKTKGKSAKGSTVGSVNYWIKKAGKDKHF
jgi:hypothetical protein